MKYIKKSTVLLLTLLSATSVFALTQSEIEEKQALLLSLQQEIEQAQKENQITTSETKIKDILHKLPENFIKNYKEEQDMFKTSQKTEADVEFEKEMVLNFKEKIYPLSKTMTKKDYEIMISDYYIDALKTGMNLLADDLRLNSGVSISKDYVSTEIKNDAIVAVATGMSFDGGDIETFMKLISEGGNISKRYGELDISLLSLAASVDNYKIVAFLLLSGESSYYVDGLGDYAIDYAFQAEAKKSSILIMKAMDAEVSLK